MTTHITRILLFATYLISFSTTAQNTIPKENSYYTQSNAGKFFMSWGGNRAQYSKSDIHFKGDNYDFEIHDVSAVDKPKGFHIDYINPTKLTNPQTNAKIGYFISDTYYVALGLDHMKYVMKQYQRASISGTINLENNEEGSIYNGNYNNQERFLTTHFLKFEHTDGLNFIYAEVGRYDDISNLFTIENTDKAQINIVSNLAAGVLYPKTNSTFLTKTRYDEFHVSGYGVSLGVGLNVTFLKHFYVQADLKGGFIDMDDIRTTHTKADSASQHFFYLQRVLAIGGIFNI